MIPESKLATLDILNIGAGHLRLSFDPANPEDKAKAEKAVSDMLARGYSIFVEVPDKRTKTGVRTCPVRAFEPETCEYIIEMPGDGQQRLPAATTPATAVAPTAGG